MINKICYTLGVILILYADFRLFQKINEDNSKFFIQFIRPDANVKILLAGVVTLPFTLFMLLGLILDSVLNYSITRPKQKALASSQSQELSSNSRIEVQGEISDSSTSLFLSSCIFMFCFAIMSTSSLQMSKLVSSGVVFIISQLAILISSIAPSFTINQLLLTCGKVFSVSSSLYCILI